MNTPLSPAAQAVQQAVTQAMLPQILEKLANPADSRPFTRDNLIAAALRAAVGKVLPEGGDPWDCCDHRAGQIRDRFLAIAAELEAGG